MQSLSFPGQQDRGSHLETLPVVTLGCFVLFPSLLGWIPVIPAAWQGFGKAASCCHSLLPRGETFTPSPGLGAALSLGFSGNLTQSSAPNFHKVLLLFSRASTKNP